MQRKRDISDIGVTQGSSAVLALFDKARPYEPRQSVNGADTNNSDAIKSPEPRFRLVPFEQLVVGPEPVHLVKGLIPRTGLVVVWGPPKCGKSFWTFDLTLHVALNWSYRGRKVLGGPIVYCAFEGQEGYGRRAEAFRHNLPEHADPIPFYLIPARMSFAKDHAELITAINAQLGTGTKPVAVVLDTLNRSLEGSESDDKDMGAYIRAGDAVREAFNCAVIIVHHCGIEGTRPRGHTSLTGAVDAQLAIKRDTTGNIVATVEWMKDGPEGEIIVSRLERVEVGQDKTGEPITSCIVVPVEGAAARPSAIPNRRLPDRAKRALDALTECALGQGTPAPAEWGLPAGIRTVPVDVWRAEISARGIFDGTKNPRGEWRRLRDQLAARQVIGERDGRAWRA